MRCRAWEASRYGAQPPVLKNQHAKQDRLQRAQKRLATPILRQHDGLIAHVYE